MNSDIKDIIKFAQEIRPKLTDFKKIFSFNSKDYCKNKILVLSNLPKKNTYHYITENENVVLFNLILLLFLRAKFRQGKVCPDWS